MNILQTILLIGLIALLIMGWTSWDCNETEHFGFPYYPNCLIGLNGRTRCYPMSAYSDRLIPWRYYYPSTYRWFNRWVY